MRVEVIVHPGASRNRVRVKGDRIEVWVKAPPAKGKANRELVRFLSRKLAVSAADIRIVNGHFSRVKILDIPLSRDELLSRLSLDQKAI